MKKTLFLVALASLTIACNKTTETASFKTAYVDSAKLMKDNEEAKKIEEKYKMKADEEGRSFETKVAQFRQEAAGFQQNAMAKGQAWAQQKGAELQRREQELAQLEQQISQKLQSESGKEMDSLVTKIKKHIKEYGKKNGYDYIYSTGDITTILYAKESYDITDKISKELNELYKKQNPSTTEEEK
jgi:outer membrane protein